MNQESPRTIVLASRSPRRLQLATAEGWRVTVIEPPEEAEAAAAPRGSDESLAGYVRRLALAKARAVVDADSGLNGLVLACDTLAEVDGRPQGKPVDRADARRMLRELSGRRHRVVSGICLWPRPHGTPILGDAESILEMGELTADFLDWYLDTGMWMGKAGACGFQDERLPLRLVEGSPSNVVGLPLELVREMLATLA